MHIMKPRLGSSIEANSREERNTRIKFSKYIRDHEVQGVRKDQTI